MKIVLVFHHSGIKEYRERGGKILYSSRMGRGKIERKEYEEELMKMKIENLTEEQ